MKSRDISEARDADLRASHAAMRRAATMARDTAIRTRTGIVIARDGKAVTLTASQLRDGSKSGATRK